MNRQFGETKIWISNANLIRQLIKLFRVSCWDSEIPRVSMEGHLNFPLQSLLVSIIMIIMYLNIILIRKL